MRPSGTEPKVKCYYEVVKNVDDQAFSIAMNEAQRELEDLVQAHQNELAVLLSAPV